MRRGQKRGASLAPEHRQRRHVLCGQWLDGALRRRVVCAVPSRDNGRMCRGALGQRTRPCAETARAFGVDHCEPRGLIVGDRIAPDELSPVRGVARLEHITAEVRRPLLHRQVMALEPLLHALRGDEILRVPEVASGRVEGGRRESGPLLVGRADARRPFANTALDGSPFALPYGREDDVPPAVPVFFH